MNFALRPSCRCLITKKSVIENKKKVVFVYSVYSVMYDSG